MKNKITHEFVEFNRLNKTISKELVRKKAKTTLFTSAGDGEGKTFMAINIALNFIKNTPLRILLIDMNIRNPQIHEYFKLQKLNGVTDILNDNTHFQDTLKKTEYNNLSVITAGTYGGIITQSFNKLRILIENIKSQFDLIIIESSPILVSNKNNVDPAILSSLIDLVFMVVLARKTRKVSVIKSKELLKLAGGEIYGIVLNNKYVSPTNKKGASIS